MEIKIPTIAVVTSILVLALLPGLSFSQNLGQSAGSLVFNVSLGGNQTLSYSIFDGGSSQITFSVSPPQYNPIANNINPTVTVTPLNGVLQPGQQINLQVTVFMPASNHVGVKWDGIMQVLAATNTSNPGGAVVQGGLGKEVIIYSQAPPPIPQKPGFQLSSSSMLIIGGVVVVIVVVGAAGYLFKRKPLHRKASQGTKNASVDKRVRELEKELSELKKGRK